ncbi:hypothetical protein, partial [Streptomyces sp. NRRL S-118]|uniref:hypothetical protein n=1 Tax=Streptomyces sp. NRRL S-118 TaxID=1463881 RepID=UPI001F26F364
MRLSVPNSFSRFSCALGVCLALLVMGACTNEKSEPSAPDRVTTAPTTTEPEPGPATTEPEP